MNRLGCVYLAGFFIASAITNVVTKHLYTSTSINPYHFITYSSFIGVLILVVINRRMIVLDVKKEYNKLELVSAALIGIAVFELFFNLALDKMTASQTTTLFYTNPILLYLISCFRNSRRIKLKLVIGLMISFLGVYLVVTQGSLVGFVFNQGIIYIIISVFSFVYFTIKYGEKTEKLPIYHLLLIGQIFSAIFGAVVLTINQWWIIPSFYEIIWIFVLSLVYNVMNWYFYLMSVEILGTEKFAILSYLSPLVTYIAALAFINEVFLVTTLTGLLMVIAGNIIGHFEKVEMLPIFLKKKSWVTGGEKYEEVN